MNVPYDDYLHLLDQMASELSALSRLAREKAAAVKDSDLNALDQVLKKEQASSLTFRGLEHKKDSLLKTLGLIDVPLSALAEHYPAEKRLAAKASVENLQTQYKLYEASAEVARNTLECNLHEIEKIVAAASSADAGPGYQTKAPDVPSSMKTDFRA